MIVKFVAKDWKELIVVLIYAYANTNCLFIRLKGELSLHMYISRN